MTVNTATSTATYTGNGTTTVFSVPFYFLVNSDVQVQKKVAATGVVSTLALGTDYTLTGAGVGAGGTLTATVVPATGDTLYISRNVSAVQQTAYPVNSPFPAASHETALDRLTMLVQQIQTALGLTLQKPALSSVYDLAGNTLINEAVAVNAADVPNLAQVQALVASTSSGIPPSLIATTADLASTATGKGSKLIAFIQRITGAVARWVEDKLAETISVKDFGAVGDGVTDDTAAFQLALNNVPAGCVLLVPRGTYVLGALTCTGKSISIRGQGIKASILYFTGTTTLLGITPGDITRPVSIAHISLYAGNATVASGTALSIVYPTTASWVGKTVTIDEVEIYSNLTGPVLPYWANGIYLKDCWNSVISRVWFSGKANDSGTTGSFINFDENCTDSLVIACHAYFAIYGVVQTGYGEGIRIEDCVFVDVGRGYHNTTTSVLGPWIQNCHINAATYCVDVQGAAQTVVQNCALYTSYAGAAGNVLLSDSSDCMVTGNSMFTTIGTANGVIVANVAATSARNQITGNSFSGFANGVWLKAGVNSNVISGNQAWVSGSASSALLDQSATYNSITRRVYTQSIVKTVAGGSATATVDFALPVNFFSAAPTTAFAQEAAVVQYISGYFDHDSASTTATNARFVVRRADGAAITAGSVRFSLAVYE